jgi:hypothetical protein
MIFRGIRENIQISRRMPGNYEKLHVRTGENRIVHPTSTSQT